MQESILNQIKNIALKSGGDNIFIIGKGPSIDAIRRDVKMPGIIINLNDSELLYPGDIGIFYSKWVSISLESSGYKCQFYLAGYPLPKAISHEVLPIVDSSIAADEFLLYRLESSVYYNESFVLLNALKVAAEVAKQRGRIQTVYLLGFDFTTAAGNISKRISLDHSDSTGGDRSDVVQSQEHELRQLIAYFLNKEKIILIHVGGRDFSRMGTYEFNYNFKSEYHEQVGQHEIKSKNSTLVVAEFTNNHLGNADRLIMMVHLAKAAGADLIKVQKRDVATFYSREKLNSYYWSPFGNTLGAYREGVELSEDLLRLLDETCKEIGIGWFCSTLDYPSFKLIMQFSPCIIKIPSTISGHKSLHRRIADEYRGPIVVSTGFTDSAYIDYVLSTFKSNDSIYLMHCVSAYPTPKEHCNIAVVRSFSDLSKTVKRLIPSYSSHDAGSLGSMLAVAAGAKMVEKHVKFGNVEWVHFDRVALDLQTSSFADYIKDIRSTEQILGSPDKKILSCENHKYQPINP